MEIKQLNMQEMNLDSIDTAHYNPRKDLRPGDVAYDRLKASILTYGYIDPMIYNERTGRLVGGHQRLKILRDLGIEKAQVSVVDLDEPQEKALNVTLNKVQGEFETTALAEVLQELEKEQFNLDNLGFNQQEFDDLVYEMEMEQQRSGSFLNDIIQTDTEVNEIDNTDNTGINTREPLPFEPDEDVNVNRNVDEGEHDVYPSYTNPSDEPEIEEYGKEDAEQYFKMTFPVTFDERDVILEAIRQAKKDFGLSTSSEALLRICNKYLGGAK
ncbi:hypothetical protein [Priestia megaterium]